MKPKNDKEQFDEKFEVYWKKARNRALSKVIVPALVYLVGIGVISITYGWKLAISIYFITWSMVKYVDYQSSGGAHKMISDEVIALAMKDKEKDHKQDGPIGFKD